MLRLSAIVAAALLALENERLATRMEVLICSLGTGGDSYRAPRVMVPFALVVRVALYRPWPRIVVDRPECSHITEID